MNGCHRYSDPRYTGLGKSIIIGKWRLRECFLEPRRELLETFAENEAKSLGESPFIHVILNDENGMPFPMSPNLYARQRIRKLHFQSLGGPLARMLELPFKEACERQVHLEESLESYRWLEKLMYCKTIDLRDVPLEFIYVADRQMLEFVVKAMLIYAEKRATPRGDDVSESVPFLDTMSLLRMYLPVLQNVFIPIRFKRYFAVRLVCECNQWDGEESFQFYRFASIAARPEGSSLLKDPLVGIGSSDEEDIPELEPTDPWIVFAWRDMLEDIAWYFSNLTEGSMVLISRIVSEILRVEKKLSDEALRRVLNNLNWSSSALRDYFRAGVWSPRLTRLVDEHLAVDQEWVDQDTKVIEIPEFGKILLRQDRGETYGSEERERVSIYQYGMEVCIFPIDERNGAVMARFTLENPGNVHEREQELSQVHISVRLFEAQCGCPLQNDNTRYEGKLIICHSLPMRIALLVPIEITFMDFHDRFQWIEDHEETCSFRVVTRLSIGRKEGVGLETLIPP